MKTKRKNAVPGIKNNMELKEFETLKGAKGRSGINKNNMVNLLIEHFGIKKPVEFIKVRMFLNIKGYNIKHLIGHINYNFKTSKYNYILNITKEGLKYICFYEKR